MKTLSTPTLAELAPATTCSRLVLPLPWGSFLSEQLYKWKTGEIECGCREMAIHIRQIVEEEIAKGSIRGKNATGHPTATITTNETNQ